MELIVEVNGSQPRAACSLPGSLAIDGESARVHRRRGLARRAADAAVQLSWPSANAPDDCLRDHENE